MVIFVLTNIAARDLENKLISPLVKGVVLSNTNDNYISTPPTDLVAMNAAQEKVPVEGSSQLIFHNELINTSYEAPIAILNEESQDTFNVVSIEPLDERVNLKLMGIVSNQYI